MTRVSAADAGEQLAVWSAIKMAVRGYYPSLSDDEIYQIVARVIETSRQIDGKEPAVFRYQKTDTDLGSTSDTTGTVMVRMYRGDEFLNIITAVTETTSFETQRSRWKKLETLLSGGEWGWNTDSLPNREQWETNMLAGMFKLKTQAAAMRMPRPGGIVNPLVRAMQNHAPWQRNTMSRLWCWRGSGRSMATALSFNAWAVTVAAGMQDGYLENLNGLGQTGRSQLIEVIEAYLHQITIAVVEDNE